MRFDKRKWKKFTGGVGKIAGTVAKKGRIVGKSIGKYAAEAPKRRQAEITRLKQEIQIAKLREQKKKYQKDFVF